MVCDNRDQDSLEFVIALHIDGSSVMTCFGVIYFGALSELRCQYCQQLVYKNRNMHFVTFMCARS